MRTDGQAIMGKLLASVYREIRDHFVARISRPTARKPKAKPTPGMQASDSIELIASTQ
jgi:hypothetical protein